MHTHNIIIYMGRTLAGMENQYCIPMDQYQNNIIATLIESDVDEKSKCRDVYTCTVDVIHYPYEYYLCIFWHCHPYFILQFIQLFFILVTLYTKDISILMKHFYTKNPYHV